MSYDWKTDFPGVFSVHADDCPIRDGGEERCGPAGYRASVRDWTTNRRIVGPTFGSLQEALAWQRDQLASRERASGLRDRTELGALIDEYIQATEDGTVRDGVNQVASRERVRALRGALSYVDSELGTMAVQEVRRRHVQAMVDQLRTSGLAEDRIRDVVEALRSLYAYAIRRELVGFSPVVELDEPPVVNASTNGKTPHTHVPTAAEGWTTSDIPAVAPPVGAPWTPPPFTTPEETHVTPGQQWTPPSFAAPEQANPTYAAPPPPPPPQPPPHGWHQPATTPPPYQPPYAPYAPYPPQPAQPTGPLNAIFGAPTAADADYDSTMQERWLWWTVRIIVIVFVLIALVLVAESV